MKLRITYRKGFTNHLGLKNAELLFDKEVFSISPRRQFSQSYHDDNEGLIDRLCSPKKISLLFLHHEALYQLN